MRRIVVIVPDLLGDPSILRQKLPVLEALAEMGRLFKLLPVPKIETPEALYLGLRPDEGQLRQGPLTVSALNADPPERSTHFHLSLMSFSDGIARLPGVEISADDQRVIFDLAKKLNGKLLTIVEGAGVDHGLVWESIGDLGTTSASDVDGKPMRSHLPEGDADVLLRRLIDDSINILSEIELNQRRVDEGLPPLNLLWPWGEGVRKPVPNLALRRGEPVLVISASMRLQGLTRLAGYRHAARGEYGRGLNTQLSKIAETCLKEEVTIVLLDAVTAFRQRNQMEEADWFLRELADKLLKPLFEHALVKTARITFLSPGAQLGLGLTFTTLDSNGNSFPFDERALEERTLPDLALWNQVALGLG
jgi:hypothetical protein